MLGGATQSVRVRFRCSVVAFTARCDHLPAKWGEETNRAVLVLNGRKGDTKRVEIGWHHAALREN